jgi:uncharacterized protein
VVDSEFIEPKRLKELASSLKSEHKLLFKKFKKVNPDKIDQLFHKAHEDVFSKYDCLACANCCKTLSPIITYRDVDRMAKAIGVKPSAFTDRFLNVDSDGDYVFRSSPCPFLMPDNYCRIYESRPKACREYPHTDRKRIQQILSITLRNVAVCPAVYYVVEQVRDGLLGNKNL